MFLDFFYLLRENGLPVTLHEHLALMEALDKEVSVYKVEDFYFLCKTIMVKKEIHLDRFDVLFSHYFKDTELIPDEFFMNIPEEWLRRNLQRQLSEEEKKLIEAMGGYEALVKRMRELLEEQRERHEGGNKWIGTGGTSPFGAYGFNPEGIRMGQEGSGSRRGIKVWDKRDFANLNDKVELDTRNIKLALRRLRMLTREGALSELDIDDTIHRTSRNGGLLDISMVAERKNNIKVLLLMDVGGSMDDHIEICSRLFSAAKYEFKHLEFFYFHNCLYESVWKDNSRRGNRLLTLDLLRKFNKDYKVIFVGDACMSPYEILYSGGSVEHYNDEAGIKWLDRVKAHFDFTAWINPMPVESWNYFESTQILREFMGFRMFPMTMGGISQTVKALKNKNFDNRTDPPIQKR